MRSVPTCTAAISGRRGADLEVGLAAREVGDVGGRLGEEPHRDVRRGGGDGLGQYRREGGDERVVAAQGETALEGVEVERGDRGQQRGGAGDQVPGFFPQRERVRGGGHRAPGTYEDVVTGGPADAREGAAHGRRGQVQPVGGRRDAVLLQQRVERDQQIQIHMHQGNGRPYKSALEIMCPDS